MTYPSDACTAVTTWRVRCPCLKKYTIETLHFSFAAVSLLMILILFCEEHSLARECCACPTFFSPVEQTVQSPSQIFLPNWHRNFSLQ